MWGERRKIQVGSQAGTLTLSSGPPLSLDRHLLLQFLEPVEHIPGGTTVVLGTLTFSLLRKKLERDPRFGFLTALRLEVKLR